MLWFQPAVAYLASALMDSRGYKYLDLPFSSSLLVVWVSSNISENTLHILASRLELIGRIFLQLAANYKQRSPSGSQHSRRQELYKEITARWDQHFKEEPGGIKGTASCSTTKSSCILVVAGRKLHWRCNYTTKGQQVNNSNKKISRWDLFIYYWYMVCL